MLSIDVLNVSMRFSAKICIYEHIQNYVFATFIEHIEQMNNTNIYIYIYKNKIQVYINKTYIYIYMYPFWLKATLARDLG